MLGGREGVMRVSRVGRGRGVEYVVAKEGLCWRDE